MLKIIRYFSALISILLSVSFSLQVPAFAETTTAGVSVKNTIGIEVTTHLGDKQIFKQGDIIAFLISLDKDAHILMIYQDAEQNLVQVIPNRYRQKDRYSAGLFIAVPDQNEPFEFTVNPPFGKERLWVFASSRQFPTLEGTELKNGLKLLKQDLTGVLATVRPRDSHVDYGESSTVIMTEPH